MTDPRLDPHALLDHDDFLRALARGLVRDAARADDVVQQSYVAALSSGERGGTSGTRLQQAKSPRAWLAGVVRHVAWKLRRSESRRDAHEQAAAQPEALPSVAQIVAREQTRKRVVEAVLALDEPARTTMVLRYFDRLPPRAIAKRLGEPVETVRSRVQRTLERLRTQLDRDHGGDRGAWLAALLPFAKAAPLGPLAAVSAATATALGSVASGVVLMSAKAKLVSTAVVLASATLAWVFLHGNAADDAARARAAASDRSHELPSPAVADDVASKAKPAELGASRVVERASEPKQGGETPTTAAVDPRFASLVVKARWERDGRPASGILLSLYVWARTDHYLFLPEATTDAEGVARFEKIEPGFYLVLGDRSGQTRGSVVAGKTTEIELVLKDGADVDGEVVDAKGHGVADAAIWLGFDGNQSDNGSIVTHSDEHGHFAIASVTGMRNLGARCRGFAPSTPVFVTGAAGTTVKVRLEMKERGGLVSGRVVDPDEKPVAGAVVQLGDEHATIHRAGSMPCELLLRTKSDADGRFEFDGAMTGEQPLVVRARELAPWIGSVTVNGDVAANVVVRLPRGATLEGKVVDSKQQPASGVTVAIETGSRLADTETGSASDGTFRCEHVLPGHRVARAELEGKSAKTRAEFDLADGATVKWDCTLASGLVLRGRVVHRGGAPIAGCFVVVDAMVPGGPGNGGRGDWFSDHQTTDVDGRFVIEGCPPSGLNVRVDAPRNSGITPFAELRDVKPSDDELVVEVPDSRLSSVYLEGVVVDADGKPVENASYYAASTTVGLCPIYTVDAHTGHFKTGPYAPGDFVLHVMADGFAEKLLPVDHVVKDETRDVGTIRLERGAPITVRAHDESGQSPAGLQVQVRVAGTERFLRWETKDGVTTVERAEPGDYDVSIGAPGFVPTVRTVKVESDKPVELDVALHAGRAVTLRATFSPLLKELLSSEGHTAIALLRDASGTLLSRVFVGQLGGDDSHPWTWQLALLPGRHTLDLVVDGEPTAKTSFDVPGTSEGSATIDVSFD